MNSAPNEKYPLIYLKPGEMHISETPSVVVTVLGSCLAITMFNRRIGLGAISHGLLPECSSKKLCTDDCTYRLKFVDCSIKQMLKHFDRHTIKRHEIEVKCFGGADMFGKKPQKAEIVSVGKQNIITAKRLLEEEGLRLSSIDVGGLQGRKLLFYTHTGEVLLKRLTPRDMTDGSVAP